MGIPLMRTKRSLTDRRVRGRRGGAYFALSRRSANPDSFQLNFSVFVLVMVILGGMGNVWGVLVGAAFLAYLDQAGSPPGRGSTSISVSTSTCRSTSSASTG